ncbi:hypothetical protein COV93_08750 [Candidatus Woesearchaeota archaeon CG11_big_fil_rev_8_21_14_0_20_43_8]|nr:MAG: hypothetical protein COV93_08750 [Candidatus Woesearchaeota archaeon CG11_big_fil_rev_8_21_14_0_20_43_8]PIO04579.1 MAG: hypothetical protein COT47_08375 [Candidatus Woesearchaeota archaeon CG08_land_8_20_14_0_20_43_7]
MVTSELLLNKRNDLEQLVGHGHMELAAYDLLLHARLEYNSDLERATEEILTAMDCNYQSELSEKLTIRSKLTGLVETFGHKPAYIFVLNYDNNIHKEHAVSANYSRDCIGKHITDKEILPDMKKIAYEDNAILFDPKGYIVATNTILVNVDPSDIIGGRRGGNEELGFANKVGSRHHFAIGASYHLLGTVVYTLSETGHVRRFVQGKITFSTVDHETK